MTTTTGNHLQPGALIDGRYEVKRLLGVGGMGTVVLVNDRVVQGNEVVLKFLHHRLVPDEAQFARFQNEVVVMREMQHPNIVKTFDIGQLSGGAYFISMEHVRGCSLGSLLAGSPEGKMPFSEALPILYEIAIGLAHAHSKGIIHRDLKPDNILISSEGDIKITDFGLAKAIELDMSLTEPGETVGTPYYMAPEQFRGEGMDGRTDIYSFGVMAYELVVGERPFQSENFIDLAQQHFRKRIPSFAGRHSGVANWFQDFVEKCAAKSPDKRFQSFYEVIEVLSCFIDYNSVSPLPAEVSGFSKRIGRRWRLMWWLSRPRRVLILLIFLSVLLGINIIVGASRNNHPIRMVFFPPVLKFEQQINRELPLLRHFVGGEYFKNVTAVDKKNRIELMSRGASQVVEVLLATGVNPNGRNTMGIPYVLAAVSIGDLNKFEILAEYGADLSVEDENGRGLLTLAVLMRRSQMLTTVLLNTPKDLLRLDKKDKGGKTALHYALEHNSIANIDQLINAGASLYIADEMGATPLMYAVRTGSKRVVDRILRKNGGAGIDSVDASGQSALLIAAQGGKLDIVELLLSFSPDLALSDNTGRTSLMFAAAGGYPQVCEALLRRQSSLVAAADKEGRQAVDYAEDHQELVELLKRKISEL